MGQDLCHISMEPFYLKNTFRAQGPWSLDTFPDGPMVDPGLGIPTNYLEIQLIDKPAIFFMRVLRHEI